MQPADTAPIATRLAVGSGHEFFSLSGRLSVRDGQRVEIAGLRWERTPAVESVTLTSPLGSTVARMWKEAGGVARFRSSDRETTAVDLESLIVETLGTPVPLAALGWWIQGLEAQPREGVRGQTRSAFQHEGWDIRIEEFPLTAAMPVAKRIVARRAEVTLRLVIDEWEPRN
ncbi:MAG: outer membrane lipoprotein LolB [Burkholderiales bacterium]|nr:outer membrane lipoprotein LolB [Burkholderiales bacterium]